MSKFASGLTILALVLAVSQPLTYLGWPTTATAATVVTLFSDGFESSNFTNWTYVDSPKWTINNGTSTTAHSGIKRAEVKGNTNPGKDDLRKSVSTVDHNSIVFSYWYKANDLESSDDDRVEVEYTIDGSTWTEIFQIDDNNDDNNWHQKTHNLPITTANNSNFAIRFSANLDSGNDYVYLDDVSVTGELIPNGSISGHKWNDLSRDGVEDENEPILESWTISLYKNDELVTSTTTDASGQYSFTGLEDGSYTVCEELPDVSPLWHQSYPTSGAACDNGTKGHSVTISSGSANPDKNFGNYQNGSLTINKITQPAETDQEFAFSGSALDGLDEEDKLVVGSGTIGPLDLAPGSYTLEELSVEGWDLTGNTCENGTIEIVAGGEVTCDFTNTKRGTISVSKIANPDEGTFTFHLTGPEEYASSQQTVGSTEFDIDFSNLKPGDYQLTEELPAGWSGEQSVQCSINDAEYSSYTPGDTFTLTPGGSIKCIFNNSEYGLITGKKFKDKNGNGAKDQGEGGLKNWTIRLYRQQVTEIPPVDEEGATSTEVSWNIIDETTTGNGGNYTFGELSEGTYKVCEVAQEGWLQSVPNGGSNSAVSCDAEDELIGESSSYGLQVAVQAGETKSGIYFGNFKKGSITGYKWNDVNGNGAKDQGENKLNGWTIKLYDQSGQTEVATAQITGNSGNGKYKFDDLMPGTYLVREVAQAGWAPTAPVTGEQLVVVNSGQNKKKVNFGNREDHDAPILSIGLGNGNDPDNTGPEHGSTVDSFFDVFATFEDANSNSYHFRVVKEGGNLGHSCGDDLALSENQGYGKCGYAYNHRVATTTSFTNAAIETLDPAQLAAVGGGYGEYRLIIGADDRAGNRTAAPTDWQNDPWVRITIAEAPEGDHEAPSTIITSPNPETEWEDIIFISGTTTDNVAVATTTLSFSVFTPDEESESELGGSCGEYTPIISLANSELDAIFDWTYDWTPDEDGLYCIEAKGIDTSGNEEGTAVVAKIKFVKTTIPETEGASSSSSSSSSGSTSGGGGSSHRQDITGLLGGSSSSGSSSSGSTSGGSPLALIDLSGSSSGGSSSGSGGGEVLGGATTTGTSTNEALLAAVGGATSTSGLLAALGSLTGSWWLWIILLILILIGLGYWWWQQDDNSQV